MTTTTNFNINIRNQNTECSLGDLDQHTGRSDISPISFLSPKFSKPIYGDSDDSSELNDTFTTLTNRYKTPVNSKKIPAKSVGDMNEVNKRLIAQVSALKQLGPASQRIKDLEDQIEILLNDNMNFTEISFAQKADIESLRNDLDSAQIENKNLDEKNQQLSSSNHDLEAQIKHLDDERRQKSIEVELCIKKFKAQEALLKQEIDDLQVHKKARDFDVLKLGEQIQEKEKNCA